MIALIRKGIELAEEQRSGIERHIQSVLAAAAIALLVWSGNTLVELRDRLTKFEERLVSLQAQVNVGTDDRFRRSDWVIQKERLDERFIALRSKVEEHERQIETLVRRDEKFHGNQR